MPCNVSLQPWKLTVLKRSPEFNMGWSTRFSLFDIFLLVWQSEELCVLLHLLSNYLWKQQPDGNCYQSPGRYPLND